MTEIPVQKTEDGAITKERHSLENLKKYGFLKRPKSSLEILDYHFLIEIQRISYS